MSKSLSPTIIFFGITSLLADVAGEMIFPILPQYFTVELGLSVALLGIIEGIADGSANLLQVWFGWLSDRLRRRKIFVIAGYAVAAIGKIFLAFTHTAFLVFLARFFDRGGKGIRTTPRDAMLAESIDTSNHGFAFGFHRMMDSAGAILGNALVIWLIAIQLPLRHIVWLSLIPAVLAILFILPVKEMREATDGAPLLEKKITRPTWKDFTEDRKRFGSEFWKFIIVSVIFHLGKISYAFMLLRAANLGIPAAAIPLLYLVFNIVQTAFSLPVGKMADGFGKAILVFISFILFALMSFGFISGGDSVFMVGLFAMYGLSFAFIEVGVRAFAVELSPPHLKATGLGIFFTVTGFTVVLASWIAGFLWQFGDGIATFWYSTITTSLSAVIFFIFFRRRIFGAFERFSAALQKK